MSVSVTMPLTHAAERALSVLVVGPVPPPHHGGSVATAYVLESCRGNDWDVIHLDTSDRRGVANIGRLDAGNVALALRHGVRFLKLLLTARPDVVYVPIAQNTLGLLRDLLFLIPAVLLRRRLVVHVHGGGLGAFYEATNPLMRRLLRATVGRASRVIVLGDALRATVREFVRSERVVVLPNGKDDSFGFPPQRLARSCVRVLYLGNLIESKGFLDVLRAAERLIAEGVDLRVDLAGAYAGAAEEQRTAPLVARLGDRVSVHGAVDGARKQALLANADVFVFPTYYPYEGHPYVILEAMAAGLPVIATRHAAIPETVIDGETGLLVAPRDLDALTDAMRRSCTQPALRQRLGDAGRTRYLEQYTIEAWSRGLSSLLRGVTAA